MSVQRQPQAAFTIPEMLAVIAIIVIIISLLLPAIGRARLAVRTVTCQNNHHQLVAGWRAYVSDNGMKMMGAHTFRNKHDWVVNAAAPVVPTNETEDSLKNGRMYEYVGTLDIYRCPDEPKEAYIRSYSMNNFVGGSGWYVNVQSRTSALPEPGNTMVFIDEPDPRGYNWGSWVVYPKGHAQQSQWIDWAASFHNGGKGGVFSYADGRAEYRQWKDPRTSDITWFYANHPDNVDLQFLQSIFNPGDTGN